MSKEPCPKCGHEPYLVSVHAQQHGENCPNDRHIHVECLTCGYKWTSKKL